MKFYIAVSDETGEPFRPPHTRFTKSHKGTARLYTTAGRARAAVGRRQGYSILCLDTEYGEEVEG